MATSHHQQHSRVGMHTKKSLPPHSRQSSKSSINTKRNVYNAANRVGHRAVHVRDDEEDEGMAASFLQFCATCEKQIICPSNALLYCSESCRKRDTKATLYSTDQSPPPTPFSQLSFEDLPVRDIVTPRSPTQAPNSNRSSILYPSDSENEKDHFDNGGSRTDSDAARYLRQFQITASYNPSSRRPARPAYHRASTSITGVPSSAAPSLSHTPASYVSLASMPYTPSNNRPLPPRKNPYSTSVGARSVELVTPLTTSEVPHAPTSGYSLKSAPSAGTSTGLAEGQIMYMKKTSLPGPSPGQGSLTELLSGRGPRTRPY